MLPACYKVNSTSAACVKMCRIAFRIRIYSHQHALMLTFSLEYALLICEHNRIKSAIIERLAVLLRVLKPAYKLCQLVPLRYNAIGKKFLFQPGRVAIRLITLRTPLTSIIYTWYSRHSEHKRIYKRKMILIGENTSHSGHVVVIDKG